MIPLLPVQNMLATSLGTDMTVNAMDAIRGSLGVSPTVSLLQEMGSDKIAGRTGYVCCLCVLLL